MFEDLPAPPFRPDRPSATAEVPVPEGDPAQVFGALGVPLPAMRVIGRTVAGQPIWSGEVEPGYPAADLWTAARDWFPGTGWWPVLTEPRTFDGLEEAVRTAGPAIGPGEWDGVRWLDRAYTAATRDGADFPRSPRPLTSDDLDHAGFGWADAWAVVGDEFAALTLVPAPAPWLVPYLLNWWGACNYDLGGADHAAMLHRWAGHWRAELLALGLDTITLRVDAPPRTDPDALTVALEHHLYCPDSVYQGVETLDNLKPQTAAPLWQLWWD
ncbi:DUF4253 domain-containing protein [Nocardia sp. BMG111209]|uniref:DUF4253 domain-containing protein n=1 Tax=Nocardia sp. BMG111209 TaxID=1160137 RepID=UPI0018CBB655|nr:DUF4253 domain-containing protein [Nocardia sp. BMG111209]